MVTIEYRGADGTPFPVTFASSDDAALTWRLEHEHVCGPMTPLSEALGPLGKPGGMRAFEEAGLPPPAYWGGVSAHGFTYHRDGPPSVDDVAALFAGCAALVETYGSSLGIWRDFSLPRVRAACARLQECPAVPVAQLAEECDYAMQHTMVSSMVTWNDMQNVEAVCREVYGDDAALVAHELSQGYDNETLAGDRALAELARLVSRDRGLLEAVSGPEASAETAARRAAGDHREFFVALDEFLDVYGWRAETWSVNSPTWRELGNGFWSQLRQFARNGTAGADDALTRGAERRQALVAEIDRALDGKPDLQARFHRRVERLAAYVPVREERALWQLISVGSLRHALLSRGADLVDRGVIDAATDVLFVTPAEIDDAPADLRAAVAARRAEHRQRETIRPPIFIGGEQALDAAATTASPGTVLQGATGSRGVATGTARVIIDLVDAHRLEPGDILVCPMTSPPWTALFAVAGAVVTDSGEISSHPAIAAREYGIPCVVGTGRATSTIPDGATVIVDGTSGTVEFSG